MSRSLSIVVYVSTVLLACGGSKPAPTPRSASTQLPPAFVCGGVLPPGESFAEEPGELTTVPPGPMSEAAAEAKRLFDAEKYDEAIPQLRTVGLGQSGDDRANRQIAKFRLGVALLRTGHDREGMALLGAIARDPSDPARMEMLLWLSDDAIRHPILMHLLSGFDDRDIERLQRERPELSSRAAYLLGRERFERAANADAIFFFSRVARKSSFSHDALDCIGKIEAKTKAAAPPH